MGLLQRSPVQSKAPRGSRVNQSYTMPAPMGGWNTKDPLVAMDPSYAPIMDNWWPDSDGLKKRGGSIRACPITSEVPRRLRGFEAGSVAKLVAFSQTTIWDATTGTPTALQTGNTTYDWDTAVFANRLIMVGQDAEQAYDGTSIAALTFTGHPGGAKFIGCHGHNGRMYYWQPNATGFYYTTAAGSFQGALALFDLQYVTTLGGHIVAMQSWSIAGGDQAAQTMLAIFWSSGDVLIYAGADPAGTDYALVGHYHAPPILGRRMVPRWGGDVMMGTLDGFYPLSKLVALGALTEAVAISDKIQPSVKMAAASVGSSPYWGGLLYSFGDTDGKGGMLLYNVPSTAGIGGQDQAFQYVMNIRTGAWTRFVGMNAYDWTIFRDQPYFCALGGVYKFNSGLSDNPSNVVTPITSTAVQAFSTFGLPGQIKKINFVRPYVSVAGELAIAIGMLADFNLIVSVTAGLSVNDGGTAWDVGTWDVASWGLASGIEKQWQTVPAMGEFLAPALQIQTASQDVKWFSTGILYEAGNSI